MHADPGCLHTSGGWQRDYASHGEATWDITGSILGFYNERHRHSTLGYPSPSPYECKPTAKTLIEVPEIA